VMLKLIGSFKTFDQVFIMTGGGPLHSSDTILTFLYQQGFERFDFGYASAVGVIFLILVATLSALQAWLMRAHA
jgi:ABC-type sugar transport system permease subunit